MNHSDALEPEIPVPGVSGYLRTPGGRTLFCVSHRAASGAQPLRGTVVLWQACSEERKASHRTMVRLAGALAAAGFTTHRIDLPGCGESTGSLTTMRLQDWLADATFAVGALAGAIGAAGAAGVAAAAKSAGPVWIGGLRMGAAVAGLCEAPAALASYSVPVRWLGIAPILQGGGWLRQLRTRRSIRSELSLAGGGDAKAASATSSPTGSAGALPPRGEDFDGFLLGPGLLADLEALDLPRALKRTAGVVVQAGAGKTVGREVQALEAPGRALTFTAVRQEPFWERGEAVNDKPLIAAVLAAVLQG